MDILPLVCFAIYKKVILINTRIFFPTGCGNDGQFRDLCKKLELDHLSLHPNFMTNELRVKHRTELVQIIESQLQMRTNSEWNEILEGAKFPYGPVNPLRDVFQDPQVLHNQMVRKMEHEALGTTIKQVKIHIYIKNNISI